jgi:hypothetical protein
MPARPRGVRGLLSGLEAGTWRFAGEPAAFSRRRCANLDSPAVATDWCPPNTRRGITGVLTDSTAQSRTSTTRTIAVMALDRNAKRRLGARGVMFDFLRSPPNGPAHDDQPRQRPDHIECPPSCLGRSGQEFMIPAALCLINSVDGVLPRGSVPMPVRAPSRHAYGERFARSIKERSALGRVLLLGERHLRRTVAEFVAHYHAKQH